MARREMAGRGMTGRGTAWNAGQGLARLDLAQRGITWLKMRGLAQLGRDRRGGAWHSVACLDLTLHGLKNMAKLGMAWLDWARPVPA